MSTYDKKQPFLKHIHELRSRILASLFFIFLFSAAGYLLREKLLDLLLKPIGTTLIYTSPAGAINFIFKISFIFGLFCTIPVILYEVFKFISPIFSTNQLKRALVLLIFSTILLLSGAIFAYLVILPASFNFLTEFSSDKLSPLISTESYLDFVTAYLLGFGVIFQLPLILIFLNFFYKLSSKVLIKYLRYIVLFSFIFSAIITPTPDFLNQCLIALPFIILYIFSILIVWIINRLRK